MKKCAGHLTGLALLITASCRTFRHLRPLRASRHPLQVRQHPTSAGLSPSRCRSRDEQALGTSAGGSTPAPAAVTAEEPARGIGDAGTSAVAALSAPPYRRRRRTRACRPRRIAVATLLRQRSGQGRQSGQERSSMAVRGTRRRHPTRPEAARSPPPPGAPIAVHSGTRAARGVAPRRRLLQLRRSAQRAALWVPLPAGARPRRSLRARRRCRARNLRL